MPDDLKPGDEIVFTVTGDTRLPRSGDWYLKHTDEWNAFRAYGDHGGDSNYPILTRTVRRAGERPGYFDARFEKIEAAIAAIGATVDGMLAQSRSPEAIVKNMAIVTETLTSAIRADRERAQ